MNELKAQAVRIMIIGIAIFFVAFFLSYAMLASKMMWLLVPLGVVTGLGMSAQVRKIKCPKCQQPYGIKHTRNNGIIVPEFCQACQQRPE